jgi:hypothetical protein
MFCDSSQKASFQTLFSALNRMDLLMCMPKKGTRTLDHFVQSHEDFFREKRLAVPMEDQMDAIFGVFRKEITWYLMDTIPSEKHKKFLNFLRSSEHHLKWASFMRLGDLGTFKFHVFSNLVRVVDTSSNETSYAFL